MIPIDPGASKDSLRFYLLKINEYEELDSLIKEYVRSILGHKIIMSPSKGPYGEKGKDIVAIEDNIEGCYCCYVVKKGTLQANLTGDYGIIIQMREALLIDLEVAEFQKKKRTVVVVHNGDEGYRGAIQKFEEEKLKLENEIQNDQLLRPISRWDIEDIVERLFPHWRTFKKMERIRLEQKKIIELTDISKDFHTKAQPIINTKEINHEEMKELFKEHYSKIDNLFNSYSIKK